MSVEAQNVRRPWHDGHTQAHRRRSRPGQLILECANQTGRCRCRTREGAGRWGLAPPARPLTDEHCLHIRPNDPLERILSEIKRWTRVGGADVSGRHSALSPTTARLRHIAGM